MRIIRQYKLGEIISIKEKCYFVVGTVGINGYLLVEKDADPKELADVKFFQAPWVIDKAK